MIPRFLIEVPDQPGRSDDLPPERRTLIPQHPRRQAQRIVKTSQTQGCCVCGRLRGPAVRGPAGSAGSWPPGLGSKRRRGRPGSRYLQASASGWSND